MTDYDIKSWVYVAWHLHGSPALFEWINSSPETRSLILAEVAARIELHNEALSE